jgi:hypothetical protein
MCGIFRLTFRRDVEVSPVQLKSDLDTLFRLSESRGKEAAGLTMSFGNSIKVLKRPVSDDCFHANDMFFVSSVIAKDGRAGICPC